MSAQRFKQALVLLGLTALIVIGLMVSSIGQPRMAQSDINRLAEQLSSRLALTYESLRAQCSSIDCVPSCKQFNEAYTNLAMMIFRAKSDDTGASLQLLQRKFDERPDIIH